MVWMEAASSVPPHIQPPMAHVPRATRVAGLSSPGICVVSIFVPPLDSIWHSSIVQQQRFCKASYPSYKHDGGSVKRAGRGGDKNWRRDADGVSRGIVFT